MQPPVMPDDGHTTRVTSGSDVSSSSGKDSSVPEPIWDDEDTKAFYEFLPDLRFVWGYNSYHLASSTGNYYITLESWNGF